tara:strand:- start:275 stop:490 length:216 start_codon:yes stop_codon:yes gene_type:complete
MSENTTTTEKRSPNPQKVKWKNVAYYNTFDEAHKHRQSLEEEVLVKVRRCGPDGIKYVVRIGTFLRGKVDD